MEELLEKALAGSGKAMAELCEQLLPLVQSRVARALLRRTAVSRGRDIGQYVEDMTQEVFTRLLARNAAALRAWDPARGRGLPGWVRMLTDNAVCDVMTSSPRNPWREDPTEPDAMARSALGGVESRSPERQAEARERLGLLLDRLQARSTPLGMEMFERIYRDRQSVDEIAHQTGMSTDSIYNWRSRLARLLRDLLREIDTDSESGDRRGNGA